MLMLRSIYVCTVKIYTWKSKSSDSSWDTGSRPGCITGEGRNNPWFRPLWPPFLATGKAEWSNGAKEDKEKHTCAAAITCLTNVICYSWSADVVSWMIWDEQEYVAGCCCYVLGWMGDTSNACMSSRFIGWGEEARLQPRRSSTEWRAVWKIY